MGWSKERMPTQGLRHLKTIGIQTWQSSASNVGLVAIVKLVVVHSLQRYVILNSICVISSGIL
jgi:hypothetical protein